MNSYRVRGGFEELTSDEQERWLKGRIRAAGMYLQSPINNKGIKKKRLPQDLEELNKHVRVATRIYNSQDRRLRSSEENTIKGVFRRGAMGTMPPPGPVKSIDFRRFSGPNGC